MRFKATLDIAMDGGILFNLINSTEFDSYWTGENDTTAPLVLSNLKLDIPCPYSGPYPFRPI